ncbi:MAG TPA: YdeI/OmpD-associated family protein [Plantibacter sp.]|uniref:YdeI/OmpD-associated family protein n=1 Tax=unclassified Plantibacter TaxID=2624265 RepID=UPI002BF57E69|nr:YdeI/OmpD-associated family protein [Plantibacter sp.]
MGRHADVGAAPLSATGTVVRLRPDLEQAIEDSGRLAFFRGLPNSAQRELVGWVDRADREERDPRIEEVIELLEQRASELRSSVGPKGTAAESA